MRFTESAVHCLLCDLFAWYIKTESWGMSPINMLIRMKEGTIGTPQSGHKILCPEMRTETRLVLVAFNGLEFPDQAIVVTKHMPVPLEDGKPKYKKWGDNEKARYLNESTWDFKSKYRKCLRKMKKLLDKHTVVR